MNVQYKKRFNILAVVQAFCLGERLKLRRYLADRLRCELGCSPDEAENEIVQLVRLGYIRLVDISHFDSASKDMTCEVAVVAESPLRDALRTSFTE